jgi:hypothetical protein
MEDQKDNYPKNEPLDELLKWCYEKWQNSDSLVKSKYKKMADDHAFVISQERDTNINKNSNVDTPIKPMSGYNRFIKDRISDINEKYPDKEVTELFPILDEEWRLLKNSEKEKYEVQYRIEMEKYKDKLKEYNIIG